jgi:spore maturation protein CgeB
MRIALVFNKEAPHTTGCYIERALSNFNIELRHFWTAQAHLIKPEFDLYLRIDHGDYKYDLPKHLHPAVFWVIDTHLKKPFKNILRQAGHYDFVFCAQKEGAVRLKRKGINSYWLPLGCDPEIHRKCNINKELDIGFVGTDGKKSLRRILLEKLKKRYPNSFLGTAKHTQMGQIYSTSKIGFNYSINNDINMRIFEVMCSGTLLITNYIRNNGFSDLFEQGKHLVVYKNIRQLFRLIDYYLTHQREREEIAYAGHQLVNSSHKYVDRLKKMFDYIGMT